MAAPRNGRIWISDLRGKNPIGAGPLLVEIVAAVVCAAVPTAKTVFILAGEYKVEEDLVTATVSITALLSVGWLSKHESGTGGYSEEDFKKL
jgi:hypothetical protein